MAGEGRIAGRVSTADGRPVAGAAVLIAAGPPHADISALTGSDGEYALDDLRPGRYEILVNAEGHAPVRRQTQLQGGTVRVDVRLAS